MNCICGHLPLLERISQAMDLRHLCGGIAKEKVHTIDKPDIISSSIAIFLLLVWPHEVKRWFYSGYRGRVETLDAKYNLQLINYYFMGTRLKRLPQYAI